jgi:hypothetical protein
MNACTAQNIKAATVLSRRSRLRCAWPDGVTTIACALLSDLLIFEIWWESNELGNLNHGVAKIVV